LPNLLKGKALEGIGLLRKASTLLQVVVGFDSKKKNVGDFDPGVTFLVCRREGSNNTWIREIED
jgi:hypothetical protein